MLLLLRLHLHLHLLLHLLLLLLGGHDELMGIGEEVTLERSLLVLMKMAAVEPKDGSPQDDAAEVLHSIARQSKPHNFAF